MLNADPNIGIYLKLNQISSASWLMFSYTTGKLTKCFIFHFLNEIVAWAKRHSMHAVFDVARTNGRPVYHVNVSSATSSDATAYLRLTVVTERIVSVSYRSVMVFVHHVLCMMSVNFIPSIMLLNDKILTNPLQLNLKIGNNRDDDDWNKTTWIVLKWNALLIYSSFSR